MQTRQVLEPNEENRQKELCLRGEDKNRTALGYVSQCLKTHQQDINLSVYIHSLATLLLKTAHYDKHLISQSCDSNSKHLVM